MNVLDKLKRRPQPSNQKTFVFTYSSIDINNEKPFEEIKTQNIVQYEKKETETKPTKKHKIKFTDSRKFSTIDRTELMNKIKGTIGSITPSFNEKKSEEKEAVNEPTISLQPPSIEEEMEKVNEPTVSLQPPSMEEEKEGGIEGTVSLPTEDNIIIIKRKPKKVKEPMVRGLEFASKPSEPPSNVPLKPPSIEEEKEGVVEGTVGFPVEENIIIKRKSTKKSEGVVSLPSQKDIYNIKIGDEYIKNRLPKETEKFIYRSSSYYMNNRKLFIQQINKLFLPYKSKIAENASNLSCEAQSENEDLQLLTHQQIVRDYLNLYTPYRGLLLFHGLGAGKTCSSIGIAEGMKSDKQVILMTPKSLKMNFFSELKKCGDPIFKKNQFWEFISIDGQPTYLNVLSAALSLPKESIQKRKGAWLVNVKKAANYSELSDSDQKMIDEQLNEMIRTKYKDINYNGLNKQKIVELTDNYTKNPFDNTVIIIDEAHNFVSMIVNKIKVKDYQSISYKLYEYMMNASNARVILLTGTPIINYPNEIGILFNLLRGHIKTWTFPINNITNKGKKIDKDAILKMFEEKNFITYDYVEFSGNNLIITRNPFGFVNYKKREYKKKIDKNKTGGKTKKIIMKQNEPKNITKKNKIIEEKDIEDDDETNKLWNDHFEDPYSDRENGPQYGGSSEVFDKYNGVHLNESGNISDDRFGSIVKNILKDNGYDIFEGGIVVEPYKSLPDDSESFLNMFVDEDPTKPEMKNKSLFQKRILGLTSYFRSAQEQLLPRYVLNEEGNIYHIESIDMSEHQFGIYEKIRLDELDHDKTLKKIKKKLTTDEIFKISSTYRIYSRSSCNFTFPGEIQRPMPKDTKMIEDIYKSEELNDTKTDEINEDEETELNTEKENLSKSDAMKQYKDLIKTTIEQLKDKSKDIFSPSSLLMYSPKYAKILENIKDPENKGLHLLYSQFVTLEGLGIFKMVLDANGFAQLKIQKNSETNMWEIIESEEDKSKQKYALYTGEESDEERELIRNIYNSDWKFLPDNILEKLREKSENNLYGEAIKLLMISSSGAEGINLKTTRFVHIMEPYWNMVRIQQVVGRARRICSHERLPYELRTVKVFIYLSSFSKEQRTSEKHKELILNDVSRLDTSIAVTTDEYLFEIERIKDNIINKILKAVKESAIDCSLYAKSNSEEKLVCYGFGNVKTNSFSSYPTIDEDMTVKEDERREKLVLTTITIQGKKYAINKKTYELYDISDYELSKETKQMIYPIGLLKNTKSGYEIELIK